MKNIVIATLIAVLFLIGFSFYWFEYKAMHARISCAKMAQDIRYLKEVETKKKMDVQTLNTLMNNEYTFCLHSKGL